MTDQTAAPRPVPTFADRTATDELRAERVKTGRLEGDLRGQTQAVREALAARDEAARICGEAGIEIYRLRAEQDRLTTALVRARRLLIAANIIQPEQEIPVSAAALGSPRRAQEELSAANLAEHLSTHQWYSKPEFPLLHEPSAHREHIYNSDCAICRGDLSRIAAVALAYVQTRP